VEIKCDYCGKIFDYKGGIAHFKRSKKHYCSLECLRKANMKHGLASKKDNDGKQHIKYQLWCQAKKRAKKKNIEFSITSEDIPEIPKICPVLGIPIIVGKGKLTDNSPSIDRINNNKGYTKGNIRIISYRANRLKNDATIEEIRRILEDYEKIQNKIK